MIHGLPALFIRGSQAYPPQLNIRQLDRLTGQPVQLIALPDLWWKEFWIVLDQAIKPVSKAPLIPNYLSVLFTTHRNANPFAWLCGFGLGIGTIPLRHIDWVFAETFSVNTASFI
jgi:hypothetical protein